MRTQSTAVIIALLLTASCAQRPTGSLAVESDFPTGARIAQYTLDIAPGFSSPEAVTRLLEQRWPVSSIRTFCIPERRHAEHFQNLVVDSPECWKGRLYIHEVTGFDKIAWYATVKTGKLVNYSLEVYRGEDFWLLEIGSPECIAHPPEISPDPNAPRFHRAK
jgi:hypothetical protein